MLHACNLHYIQLLHKGLTLRHATHHARCLHLAIDVEQRSPPVMISRPHPHAYCAGPRGSPQIPCDNQHPPRTRIIKQLPASCPQFDMNTCIIPTFKQQKLT
jgi:hypothetical protein